MTIDPEDQPQEFKKIDISREEIEQAVLNADPEYEDALKDVSPEVIKAAIDRFFENPWYCNFCGALNADEVDDCGACSAPRAKEPNEPDDSGRVE